MSRARGLLLSVVSTLALSGLSLVTGCASHKSEAPTGAAEVGIVSAEFQLNENGLLVGRANLVQEIILVFDLEML